MKFCQGVFLKELCVATAVHLFSLVFSLPCELENKTVEDKKKKAIVIPKCCHSLAKTEL